MGRAAIRALLTRAGLLDALASRIWTAIERLGTSDALTGAQLQEKYLHDGAGTLSFSSLKTFFRGLEGQVGSPEPKVREAMAREHLSSADSTQLFTSSNYDVQTSSAVEWRFVAESDKLPSGGWPAEKKIVDAEQAWAAAAGSGVRPRGATLIESGVKRREPMAHARLEQLVAERNEQLSALDEPPLVIEEALASRLYTGPLFVKYNSVLRGLGSDVPFLRGAMVKLCCTSAVADEYESGRLPFETLCSGRHRLNTYTTTLHAINSAIVKLSKLTITTTVYRGLSGRVLPEQFWKANAFGVKGGVEPAFMSTTTNYEVAKAYSAAGGHSTIIAMQQGMVDRGADISFLSQYPHEKEILFAPLTGLEVRGSRVEGASLVVEMALSINLASLTIEEVIGKRKKLLRDMLPSLEAEMRQTLALEGVATAEGVEFLVRRLRELCARSVLNKEDAFYNDDASLQRKLGELLRTFGSMRDGLMRSAELQMAGAAAMQRYGFNPTAFSSDLMAYVKRVELGATEHERGGVLQTLGGLKPELVAPHVGVVVARLKDESAFVRMKALEVMERVGPEYFERFAPALITMLGEGGETERNTVVGLLGDLRTLSQHHTALASLLRHTSSGVRLSALYALSKLDASVLVHHRDAFISKLRDELESASMHKAAMLVLQKLQVAGLLTDKQVALLA